MEKCENCGTTIGDLETPYVWRERVICGKCLLIEGENMKRKWAFIASLICNAIMLLLVVVIEIRAVGGGAIQSGMNTTRSIQAIRTTVFHALCAQTVRQVKSGYCLSFRGPSSGGFLC